MHCEEVRKELFFLFDKDTKLKNFISYTLPSIGTMHCVKNVHIRNDVHALTLNSKEDWNMETKVSVVPAPLGVMTYKENKIVGPVSSVEDENIATLLSRCAISSGAKQQLAKMYVARMIGQNTFLSVYLSYNITKENRMRVFYDFDKKR